MKGGIFVADKKLDETVFDDEGQIVVEMTDEGGNVYYYVEEMIIPVGEEKFALLVAADPQEHICEDENCDCEDEDVVIAKIILNENGEEEYVEPTDEEFEKFQAVYEKLMDDLS